MNNNYLKFLSQLEKRAEYMPQSKDIAGMYSGSELPSDSFLIKMIKSDPEALKHYNLAVERVYYKFQNMKEELKNQIPNQMDMAQMFQDPAMTDMGVEDDSAMQSYDQGYPPQGAPGGDLAGQPSDLPEGTMVDENGNPIAPEEQQVDENGNPIAPEEQQVDENGNPIATEDSTEGEEPEEEASEEEMYPFGQRRDNKKKKKKTEKNTSSKEPVEETAPAPEEEPQQKAASVKLAQLLKKELLGR